MVTVEVTLVAEALVVEVEAALAEGMKMTVIDEKVGRVVAIRWSQW